jgi:hypothetical protein
MDVWLAQDVARKDGKGRIGILIWMILDAMDRREGYSKFQEKRVAEMLPFFCRFSCALARLVGD